MSAKLRHFRDRLVPFLPVIAGIIAAVVAALIVNDLRSRVTALDVCTKKPHSVECGRVVTRQIVNCGEYPACRRALLEIVRIERRREPLPTPNEPAPSGEKPPDTGGASPSPAASPAAPTVTAPVTPPTQPSPSGGSGGPSGGPEPGPETEPGPDPPGPGPPPAPSPTEDGVADPVIDVICSLNVLGIRICTPR